LLFDFILILTHSVEEKGEEASLPLVIEAVHNN